MLLVLEDLIIRSSHRKGRQVTLIDSNDMRSARDVPHHGSVILGQRLGAVDDYDQDVRVSRLAFRLIDSNRFDPIVRKSETRRVGKNDGYAIDRD